jgi:hypothetical protein
MKNRKISIGTLGILLIISIGNYIRISDDNFRTVEFISVLAIGMIAGLMIQQIIMLLKNKE